MRRPVAESEDVAGRHRAASLRDVVHAAFVRPNGDAAVEVATLSGA
jgi:hypothetical protein